MNYSAYSVCLLCVWAGVVGQEFYASGGRYGKRVPEALQLNRRAGYWSRLARGDKQHFDVAQRADRFFMGSRYGKRNENSGEETVAIPIVATEVSTDTRLDCLFTGVSHLYRCCYSNRKEVTGSEGARSEHDECTLNIETADPN